MRINKREEGSYWEERAASYLTGQGLRILERNFRCRIGEIDLIAREGKTLVFLEVKYRRDLKSGSPEEAVSRTKQRRICRSADYYRMLHGVPEDAPCRFDVIAILGDDIKHRRDAFAYIPAGRSSLYDQGRRL